MSDRHLPFWPKGLPHHLTIAQTSLWHNAEVSAARYPDKPCLVFYDTPIGFARLRDEAERLAGWLERAAQVRAGDRVLLLMQNCPQFVIGFYAILRANAVVVPVDPMKLGAELRHYVTDSGARTAIVSQELFGQVAPLLARPEGEGLAHALVATYSDYLDRDTDLPMPEFFRAPRLAPSAPGAVAWADALAAGLRPGPHTAGPDDLCVMPYAMGQDGRPRGCLHTHRSAQFGAMAGFRWFGATQDTSMLATLPFFGVAGMQSSMNGPMFAGSPVVLLPRWDRESAARLLHRYRIASWTADAATVADLLGHPRFAGFDLSSIRWIAGAAPATPEATTRRLRELLGIDCIGGYGPAQALAPTHLNPPERPKPRSAGIPIFDTEARIVGPGGWHELGIGEVGEILVRGPQVFQGYHRARAAEAAASVSGEAGADLSGSAFVEIDGARWLRTGDRGWLDEEGYLFVEGPGPGSR